MKLSDVKIGDEVVCHTPCVMEESNVVTTTAGKSYFIKEIFDDSFIIIDDNNEEHHFSFKGEAFDDVVSNYLIWFYPIERTVRKKKIEKINGTI